MPRLSKNLSFYLLLVASILLSACDTPPPSTLRVGTNTWIGYESLYHAETLGYYDKAAIRIVQMPSASENIHALNNGTIDAAALTLDEALTVINSGTDIDIVLIMDFSNGGDAILAKPTINNLKELRGKRIAVEHTAVGAIMLQAALEEVQLQASDIETVYCGVEKHLECFESVDAVVTFDPIKTQLINRGAKQIFDSSQIFQRIVDVLVVRKDVYKNHQTTLEKLIAGHFKALKFQETHTEEAAKLSSQRLTISSEDIIKSYQGIYIPNLEENRLLLTGESAPILKNIKNLMEIMLDNNLLSNAIDNLKINNESLLQQDDRP